MPSDLQLLRLKYADALDELSEKHVSSLIVMSGLPGTGKSHLAHQLAALLDYVVIASDSVRKTLVRNPKYNSNEHYRVFRACHTYVNELLERRFSVIFDATNLNSHAINPLRRIANQTKSDFIIIRCVAPEQVIEARLIKRTEGQDDFESDADWRIYKMLKPNQKEIESCDYIVDSSTDISWLINELKEKLGG